MAGDGPAGERRTEMLVIAFIAFLALVVAWLVAPNGEIQATPEPAPVPSPNLKVGEVTA